MNINEKIKSRRIELGLTESNIAKQIGLSWNEYFDVEMHVDEIFSFINLHQTKKICEVLKFNFFNLFDMQCPFCEEDRLYLKDYSLPRNELIRKKRIEKGISQEELGDQIGFYETEIKNLENNPDHMETWPIDFIKDLSIKIGIPLPILLDVKCKKCNR